MATHANKQQRVEREVRQTLESLDSLESVEGSPFFMTRLRQAIEDRACLSQNWLYRFTRGYRLIPVGLVLFAVLNVVSLAVGVTGNRVSTDTTSIRLNEAAQDYFSMGSDAWNSNLGSAGK